MCSIWISNCFELIMHVFEISYDQLKLVNFSIEIIHSGKHYIIVITPAIIQDVIS